MAVTQDDILKAIQDLTDVVKKGNNKHGNGMTGGLGMSEGFLKNAKHYIEVKNRAKRMGKTGAAKAAGAKANANIGAVIADELAGATKKIADFAVKMKEFEMKQKQINLEAAYKTAKIQTELVTTATKGAMSVAMGGITDGIQKSVYNATNMATEFGKKYMLSNIELSLTAFNAAMDNVRTSMERNAYVANSVASEVGGALSNIPNPYTAIAGAVVSVANSIFQANTQVEIMQIEYMQKLKDRFADFEKSVIEMVGNFMDETIKLTQSTDEFLLKLDDHSHKTARLLGLDEKQTEKYINSSAKINEQMAILGETYEDFTKMQNSYVTQSGRNVMLTGEEGQMIGAFGKLFNISDEEAGNIMGAMNVFNTSIESGSDMMAEMYKIANKMGVSNQKFVKDLQKNLKLAEKYQFKGGVEGMMKMSLWAQKVRFNMDSLSSVLEKMHTGNIEDVLQTSARLNVLGGNAAVLSDPMSMLYNAYANPEQYAKNIHQMVAGFGHFNAKTGETDFNVNEIMRMEAMASAVGMSKEEFMNQARQEKKMGRVKKILGNQYGKEETEAIAQHALYDRDSKTWKVNVLDEKEGKVVSKDINSLEPDDIKNIFPEDTQEKLVDYVARIYSIMEKNLVLDEQVRSKVASGTQKKHREEYEKRRKIKGGYYLDERTGYLKPIIESVNKQIDFATNAYEGQLNIAKDVLTQKDENGKTMQDNYNEASLKALEETRNKVTSYAQLFSEIAKGENLSVKHLENIDARLAKEYPLLADQEEKMANFEKMLSDGKLTQDELKYIFSDKVLKEKFFNMWGAKNMTNGRQQKEMEKGRIVFLNGKLMRNQSGVLEGFDWDGHVSKGKHELVDLEKESLYANENKGEVYVKNSQNINNANDLIISPKHGIWRTDPEDTIVASKPGGSLDRAERRSMGTPENINLNVNGTLTLSTGSQKIDLMEILRNDPNGLRNLTKEIIVEVSKNVFGGKHLWAPNRYTFGS